MKKIQIPKKLNKISILTNKRNLPKVLLVLILTFFLIQAYYFAFRTAYAVSPDEHAHMAFSIFHKGKLNPFIDDTAISYKFGAISRSPFLFHYIMGLLLSINIFDIKPLLYLRLFNPIISLVTVIFVYKLTLLISKNKYAGLFAAFLFSNIPMFVFLSGSVHYDNLVNMCAMGAIYFFIKTYKEKAFLDLLYTCIFIFLGLLTKFTFVPLTFLLSIVLLWTLIRNWRQLFTSFKEVLTSHKIKLAIVGVIFLSLFGLNLALYGENILKYHTYEPSCDNVLSHEICYSRNAIYKRDYDYREEASEKSGDSFIVFSYKWARAYGTSIYGIVGHRGRIFTSRSTISLIGFLCLALWAFVSQIKHSYKKLFQSGFLQLTFLLIAFTLIVFAYNYNGYLQTNVFWLGLQGRYLFPVLPILFAIGSYLIFEMKQTKVIRYILIITLLCALVFGSAYWTLRMPNNWKVNWDMYGTELNQYIL